MKKKVLILGASGNIAPYLLPGLDPYYDLCLTDIVPHPDEKPIINVDITSYQQVYNVAQGMDAIMNFTVVRDDPDQSFHVNTLGYESGIRAWNQKSRSYWTAVRSQRV